MSYSGGGFVQSQGGGGGSSPDGNKRQGPSPLRPVTIHQIIHAEQAHPEAEFTIDEAEVKDVSFVACVRNQTRTTTNQSYLVEDGTGQIDVRQWITSDDSEAEGVGLNVYVRIIGSLKTFSGKRHVNCTSIRVVEDKNEILYHAIEAVYVTLYATRGPPGGAVGGTTHHQQQQQQQGGVNPYAPAANANTNDPAYSEFTNPMQRKIMAHIGSLGDDVPAEGVNVGEIARAIGANVKVDQVRSVVEQLITEGHLYSTIDEDHVLSTA